MLRWVKKHIMKNRLVDIAKKGSPSMIRLSLSVQCLKEKHNKKKKTQIKNIDHIYRAVNFLQDYEN